MTEFKKRNLKKNKKRTMRRTNRGGGILDKIKGTLRKSKTIPGRTISNLRKSNITPSTLRNKLGRSMKRRISNIKRKNSTNELNKMIVQKW